MIEDVLQSLKGSGDKSVGSELWTELREVQIELFREIRFFSVYLPDFDGDAGIAGGRIQTRLDARSANFSSDSGVPIELEPETGTEPEEPRKESMKKEPETKYELVTQSDQPIQLPSVFITPTDETEELHGPTQVQIRTKTTEKHKQSWFFSIKIYKWV